MERYEALRLAIIDDLAANPGSTLADVRKRLNKPRATVDRQLQALHMLGVVDVAEVEEQTKAGQPTTRWYYTIANGIDPTAIDPQKLPEKSVGTPNPKEERGQDDDELYLVTDKSGNYVSGGAAPSATSLFTSCQVCGVNLVWLDAQQRGTCSDHRGHGEGGAS
jgi:hypothetical protein